DARVDDATVVSALVATDPRLFVDDRQAQARSAVEELARGGQADDAGSDHDQVVHAQECGMPGQLDPRGWGPAQRHPPQQALHSPPEGGGGRLIAAWFRVRGEVYLAALTLAASPPGSLTVPAQVQQIQGKPAPAISATFTYRQGDDSCDNVTFTWDGGTWAA